MANVNSTNMVSINGELLKKDITESPFSQRQICTFIKKGNTYVIDSCKSNRMDKDALLSICSLLDKDARKYIVVEKEEKPASEKKKAVDRPSLECMQEVRDLVKKMEPEVKEMNDQQFEMWKLMDKIILTMDTLHQDLQSIKKSIDYGNSAEKKASDMLYNQLKYGTPNVIKTKV